MNPAIIKPSFEPPLQSQIDSEQSTQSKDTLGDLVRSFRMHKVVAISVATVVFLALIWFALQRHPFYETSALIYVQPMNSKPITDTTGGAYDSGRYDTYIQQQYQTIARSDILSEAMKKAGPFTWRYPGESEQSAISRLQHNLRVEREMGSYQLSITLGGNDPVAITKVVNAITETYIHKERADELAQSDQQLQILKEERQRILADLETSRQEQAQLSSNLGVADTTGENANPYDAQLGELRTQLASARAAHAVAEAQLASVSSKGTDSSDALNAAAEETGTNDAGLAALRQTISARRSVLATQMAQLTPKNPLYKQDEEELKRLNQTLETMSGELRAKSAQQLQAKLKLDVTRTADIEARLNHQLAQQTAIATGSTPKLQRAAALAADITRLQGRFNEVDNAISAIELEHNTSGLVHLVLPAEPPLRPKPSKKLLILAAAFPAAICFGMLAAFGLYKLDPKVYIGEDVGKVLRFQPMAVLPNLQEVDSKVMDEFMLRLVAGIDQAHSSGGARTYVFTAASSETNITELVSSLAVKMDRLGYRTMILRASDALQNRVLAEEEVPKAWGETRLTKPGEARLAHVRRESFVVENLERLKRNIDLLFIEALPLLSSAEAEFAARLADVTVLIAESAQTTRKELTSCLALVQRLHVSGIAAVLSDVSLRNADQEFIAVVRNVEGRQSEIHRRDASSARARDKSQLSIYGNPDLVSHDQKTSAQL
jgi:uncharacterized protein involved in exopolysaccharide biosynthesis